jgi:hypothetical protein
LFHTGLSAQLWRNLPPIPIQRATFHQYIEDARITLLKADKRADSVFTPTRNEELNAQINFSLNRYLHNLRAIVETDTSIADNDRFMWLRGIRELLERFTSAYKSGSIMGSQLQEVLEAYEKALMLSLQHQSIVSVIDQYDVEVCNLILQNFALQTVPDKSLLNEHLLLKSCARYPDSILKFLSRAPEAGVADSLLMEAAKRSPEDLYNYAAASDELGKKIQTSNEPLIKTIAAFSSMKSGRLFFPFLDQVMNGKLSVESIEQAVKDSIAYFKLLVQTKIDYAERMRSADTPLAVQALDAWLERKATEDFIADINALHDERNPAIRFRKLDKLTHTELYYLAVTGEKEMYTSSFVDGIYPRIFQRMRIPRADSLLSDVSFDFYRRFIRICAAYNTLDDFLRRMDRSYARDLMRSFATGLEKSRSLEDAVDVADAYASIADTEIRNLVLAQVGANRAYAEKRKQARGMTMYRLLEQIFLSLDTTRHIDLTASLGIPPVFNMPVNNLKDTAGRVVIQQFFYGDKDGPVIFNAFLNSFRNPNWRIDLKPEWVEVSSVKGVPVIIYANRPLDELQDMDAQAQQNLIAFLEYNDLQPAVTIHRGHSYHVSATIGNLMPSSKVVLLGSCGGYQRLSEVLDICPNAHIIASKQIGAGVVNQIMITAIAEQIRQDKDLYWPQLWAQLEKRFVGQTRERFEDYIPPQKNLGAIFIMAYQKALLQP